MGNRVMVTLARSINMTGCLLSIGVLRVLDCEALLAKGGLAWGLLAFGE